MSSDYSDSIQLHAHDPGKQGMIIYHGTHVGDEDAVPDSLLPTSPGKAIANIQGVNQFIEDLCLSLFLPAF